jgi:transposase, IS30 family
MGIKYSHLSERTRVIIEFLLEQGLCPARIARHVGIDRSTVCRELRRGWHIALGRYTAARGQFVHDQRRRTAGLARRKLGCDLSAPAWQPILGALRAGWSPEQYCGRMRLIDSLLCSPPARSSICHETIYKAIFNLPKSQARRELTQLLRHSRAGRRHRRPGDRQSRFTGIQNMTPIEQRPAEVELRLPGHWEGDLLKGAKGQSCIATLVERHSRLVLLVPLRSAHSSEVCKAIIQRLRRLPPALRLSLTYDRGTEMAQHLTVSAKLNMPVYFCRPYSPWQRGSNENTNGLVRQYLPKGLDLSSVTHQQLHHIECALNHRPRRILGYRCPQEVLDALLCCDHLAHTALAA